MAEAQGFDLPDYPCNENHTRSTLGQLFIRGSPSSAQKPSQPCTQACRRATSQRRDGKPVAQSGEEGLYNGMLRTCLSNVRMPPAKSPQHITSRITES